MITGIGTDVVDVARIEGVYSRWGPRFLERVFDPQEREYCLSKENPAPHLAARFAAKEAFYKAVSNSDTEEDVPRPGLKDVRVVTDENGAPSPDWSSRLALAEEDTQAHLSLSHDAGIAQAFVVIERR